MSSSNSAVRRPTVINVTAKCTATTAGSDTVLVIMFFNTEDAGGKLITSGRKNYDGYYNYHSFFIDQNQTKIFKLPVPNGEYITGSILVQIRNTKQEKDLLKISVDSKFNGGNIGFAISGSTLNGENGMNFSLFEPGTVTKLELSSHELLAQKDGTSIYLLTATIQTTDGSNVPYKWEYDTYYINPLGNSSRKDNTLIKDFLFSAKNLGETEIKFLVGNKFASCKVKNYCEASKSITVKSANNLVDPIDKNAAFSLDGKAKYIGYEKTKNEDEYLLIFSDKVTYIPACAFANNKVIKEVTLPTDCKEIGPGAFCCCESLSKMNFNSKLERIDISAFHANPGISYTPGGGSLGTGSITALKDFTLPSSLLYIGSAAFRDVRCSSLRIPANTELAEDAFYDCGAIEDVYFASAKPNTTASRIFSSSTVVHVPRGCVAFYKNNKAFSNVKVVDE